jgi:hypothetical protein
MILFSPDGEENPTLLGVDWGDSRRNLLEVQKIVAPKKNSTFADGFLFTSFLRT